MRRTSLQTVFLPPVGVAVGSDYRLNKHGQLLSKGTLYLWNFLVSGFGLQTWKGSLRDYVELAGRPVG